MPELSPALYRAGTGEPLVLIHGFTATWRCWLPVLGLLVPRFEVIAPTLHGHDGGPPSPPGAETLADATDHFESTLDRLGAGLTLFIGPGGRSWATAARSHRGAPPLAVERLDEISARALGIRGDGALLVRPDGAPVALWHEARDPAASLARAVRAGMSARPDGGSVERRVRSAARRAAGCDRGRAPARSGSRT